MNKGIRNQQTKYKAEVIFYAVTGSQSAAELSTHPEVHAALIANCNRVHAD